MINLCRYIIELSVSISISRLLWNFSVLTLFIFNKCFTINFNWWAWNNFLLNILRLYTIIIIKKTTKICYTFSKLSIISCWFLIKNFIIENFHHGYWLNVTFFNIRPQKCWDDERYTHFIVLSPSSQIQYFLYIYIYLCFYIIKS